jgi:hypothetical protein
MRCCRHASCACLGVSRAITGLYAGVGFREFTRDLPHINAGAQAFEQSLPDREKGVPFGI